MINENLAVKPSLVERTLDDMDEAQPELPDFPLSRHPNYVTASGLAQLRQRLAAVEERRTALEAAGTDGAGEAAQARRELRWLRARVSSAIVLGSDHQACDRVAFGAGVEAVDQAGRHHRYRIVGEDQADPEQGLVSWVSPLARALEGARVSDIVVWKRPAGDLEIEVLSIDYAGS